MTNETNESARVASTDTSPGLRREIRRAIAYDDARQSLPQEHAMTLMAAGAFAWCALRAPSKVGTVLHAVLAGVLLARSASGRDGLRRWAGADPARPWHAGPGTAASPDDATMLEPRVTPGY